MLQKSWQPFLPLQSLDQTAIRRKLTLVLVVKLLAVLALFITFFSPSQRPHVDPERVRDRLTESPPAAGERR